MVSIAKGPKLLRRFTDGESTTQHIPDNYKESNDIGSSGKPLWIFFISSYDSKFGVKNDSFPILNILFCLYNLYFVNF